MQGEGWGYGSAAVSQVTRHQRTQQNQEIAHALAGYDVASGVALILAVECFEICRALSALSL